jgi:hypothetical protein
VDPKCLKAQFYIDNPPLPGFEVDVNVVVIGTCTHANTYEVGKLQPTSPYREFLTADERMKVAEKLTKTLHTPTSLYEKRMAEINVA